MSDGVPKLHWAVVRGQCEKVTRLIADGVDVNERDRDGETALHLAISQGREDLASHAYSRTMTR